MRPVCAHRPLGGSAVSVGAHLGWPLPSGYHLLQLQFVSKVSFASESTSKLKGAVMDVQLMREAMHSAVDRIIDQYLAAADSSSSPADQPVPTIDAPLIIRRDDTGGWTYRWPGVEGTEKFFASRQYEVITPHRTHRVRLAWTERPAWGRRDRKRAIVFGQTGPASSKTFYPWTEFVETDTGRYAAPIPNPQQPRKLLTSSDPRPDQFLGAQVERTEQLFNQITNGPSLRLVVDADDDETMIRHGYWVAQRRNRL
jgi:hypothetical protein